MCLWIHFRRFVNAGRSFFFFFPTFFRRVSSPKEKEKNFTRLSVFSQPTTRERKKGENDKKKKMVDNILQKWISNWFLPFSLFFYPEERKKKKKKKNSNHFDRRREFYVARSRWVPPVRKWSGWITKKKKKKWEKIWWMQMFFFFFFMRRLPVHPWSSEKPLRS